jgi:hypothetical protein
MVAILGACFKPNRPQGCKVGRYRDVPLRLKACPQYCNGIRIMYKSMQSAKLVNRQKKY